MKDNMPVIIPIFHLLMWLKHLNYLPEESFKSCAIVRGVLTAEIIVSLFHMILLHVNTYATMEMMFVALLVLS